MCVLGECECVACGNICVVWVCMWRVCLGLGSERVV